MGRKRCRGAARIVALKSTWYVIVVQRKNAKRKCIHCICQVKNYKETTAKWFWQTRGPCSSDLGRPLTVRGFWLLLNFGSPSWLFLLLPFFNWSNVTMYLVPAAVWMHRNTWIVYCLYKCRQPNIVCPLKRNRYERLAPCEGKMPVLQRNRHLMEGWINSNSLSLSLSLSLSFSLSLFLSLSLSLCVYVCVYVGASVCVCVCVCVCVFLLKATASSIHSSPPHPPMRIISF